MLMGRWLPLENATDISSQLRDFSFRTLHRRHIVWCRFLDYQLDWRFLQVIVFRKTAGPLLPDLRH